MAKHRLFLWVVDGLMVGFAMNGYAGAGRVSLHRASLGMDQPPSANRLIARATQRIEHDRHEIRVYRTKQPVEVPNFAELIVVRATDRHETLQNLVGKNVALIQSPKRSDEWDVYTDVVWMSQDRLTLPENVYIVKQVLESFPRQPVEVRVNGELHRLKAGEVLLVLH